MSSNIEYFSSGFLIVANAKIIFGVFQDCRNIIVIVQIVVYKVCKECSGEKALGLFQLLSESWYTLIQTGGIHDFVKQTSTVLLESYTVPRQKIS